jgi:hypothetical protein
VKLARPDLSQLQLTPRGRICRVGFYPESAASSHTPESVRIPCSEDQWWDELLPVFAGAARSGARVYESGALRLALPDKSWRFG